MTKQEGIEFGLTWLETNEDCEGTRTYEFIEMAIKALEQKPCEDAISREDLEECKELMTDINGDTVYAVRMSDIRRLPSVKPQPKIGHWIPVSKRMPNNDEDVLVYSYEYEIEIRYHDDEGWHDTHNNALRSEPIAWMPLPKPYRAGESE